jgi:hypothetical protein
MRAALRIGIVVMAATLTRGAIAAPPSAPETSPAITDAARARFNEGVALYGKKKYERSHAAFLQAHALTRNPAVLINLGLTSLKMGRPLQAARYFDRFQKEATEATPDQKARAQKGIADARRSLGAIDVTAPESAEVSVDGEPVGRAPLPSAIDVLPGRHEVTSTTTAGTKTEIVTVAAASTVKVRLAAQRPSAPPNAVLEPEHGTGAGAPSDSPPGPAGPPIRESRTTSVFSPPDTSWPVYAAGAVGLLSFTAAIVLSGLGTNADRNVTNAEGALTRNGKSPGTCSDPASAGDATIASTCSTLHSGQRTSEAVKTPFAVTLAVGAGTTLFALGWYFFAPKAPGSTDAMGTRPVRVAPLVGPRGEPGATFDLAF